MQLLGVGISLITLTATAINIYVSLRLTAIQAKMKAGSSGLEVALLKKVVLWKDEISPAIKGKYVSAQLIGGLCESRFRRVGLESRRGPLVLVEQIDYTLVKPVSHLEAI